jgi:lysozyme
VTVLGLDLSQLQGAIPDVQWQAVARDVRFVYLRCGVGNDASDTRFREYAAGAKAAGLLVGAYHFGFPLPTDPAHPGRDPETQARDHAAAQGAWASDLPVALDLEWPEVTDWAHWGCSADQIAEWAASYLATMQALVGRRPILYSYPYFLASLGAGNRAKLVDYELWLAAYGTNPNVPAPWPSLAIVQTSAGGYRLPNGCPCDEDQIADEGALAALLAST